MKYLCGILMAVASFAAAPAFAQKSSAAERFETYLQTLEKEIYSSSDEKDVAKKAIKGSSRIAAFNIQALAKLYMDFDKKFKREFEGFYDGFKAIEDNIGEADKWEKALKDAEEKGKPEAKIEELKEEIKDATKDFAKFLKKKKWVTKDRKDSQLAKFRKFLKKAKWPKYEQEKDRVLEILSADLQAITETEYDLDTLEEGDGLHELRRDLRWYLIKARVLGGMITFADDESACPVPAYARLLRERLSDDKYASLPEATNPEEPPCKISKCLFLGMVDATNRLGELKDKAERQELTGSDHNDTVPADLAKIAKAFWAESEKHALVPSVIQELKACRK